MLSQFCFITACGALFMLTGLAMHATPVLIVAGNFAIGADTGWTIAAQTTFLLVRALGPGAHLLHHIDQQGVHSVLRELHAAVAAYGPDRLLLGESGWPTRAGGRPTTAGATR